MKSALLFSLLLALVPAAARAEAESFLPAKPGLLLAQMGWGPFSPEERRALRERWEQASPEERARIREQFHQRRLANPEQMERLRPLTPEERENLRRQRGGKHDPRSRRDEGGDDDGFGAGFERRRFLDMPPAPAGDRNESTPWPGMRPGGPDGFMPRPRQP